MADPAVNVESKARCSKARGSDGSRVSPAHRTIVDRVEREEGGPCLVPNSTPFVTVADGGLLQHGIHVERGAPDLLGRSRKRRWRSVESRKRFGRARGCDRAPLSTGVLPPASRFSASRLSKRRPSQIHRRWRAAHARRQPSPSRRSRPSGRRGTEPRRPRGTSPGLSASRPRRRR